MTPTFKLNTEEFNRTFRQYAELSKRELPVILNTKGFFIARRAVLETPKTDKAKMEAELGAGFQSVEALNRKGIMRKVKRFVVSSANRPPLAAIIIQARRRRKGLKGLYGAELEKAMRKLVSSRIRAIAFLKSGWIPAIKRLQGLSEKRGAPPADKSKQYGVPKGYAVPATISWFTRCIIANTAGEGDHGPALQRYGGPALQRAFDHETASMKQYIERKLRGAAKSLGIKTN